MEAVEFIKQRNRMCVYYNNMPEGCYACPAFNAAYHNDCKISTDNPKHLVEIVERWAKEHPEETEREQQKPEQGTVGYLNPTAFKEYYAPYQSVKDLKRLYEELADRIAKLEKDHVETMCKPKRTNKDVLMEAFPHASRDCEGIPTSCPKIADHRFVCEFGVGCNDCRRNFWLAEVEKE